MIYIKVRKQVPQVSQVVTLSPIKQEKALLGQIVSTPNSSATFLKSCTTFGRRNYLLSFPDFSRRFSFSLAKSIDTFWEVLLKGFTPS